MLFFNHPWAFVGVDGYLRCIISVCLKMHEWKCTTYYNDILSYKFVPQYLIGLPIYFFEKKSKNDLECIQLKPWLHKMGFFSDFADSNIFSVLVIIRSKICFADSITYRMKLQEESYKGHLPLNNQ